MGDIGNWLGDNQWAIWLSIAMILGVLEMLTLDLALGMLAAGALVGGGLAAANLPPVIQVLGAGGSALALLFFMRPALLKKLHSGPELRFAHEKMVGQAGTAQGELSATASGRIKVGGEEWTAKPFDETLVIAAGSAVEILQIRGATAYVHPIPTLEEN